jgi:hypothetical protein
MKAILSSEINKNYYFSSINLMECGCGPVDSSLFSLISALSTNLNIRAIEPRHWLTLAIA